MGTAMHRPGRELWAAQPDPRFLHKPVICVGGGPSLKGFDLTPYKDIPTIAVNQAYEIAPWAQYLFFADRRWYMWPHNKPNVDAFPGIKVTVGKTLFPPELDFRRMIRDKDAGLCHERTHLAGIDSGCVAVNLAFHLGASRIILLGYDSGFSAEGMSHFHNKHQVDANHMYYTDRYGPRLSALAQRLRDVGVPVVRSTPPGRPDIPYVPLPDALTMDPLPAVEGMITSFVP